ncbi:MAG: hypothetical protein AB2598_19555 [Candidatus Thiodiazotropha sp.]
MSSIDISPASVMVVERRRNGMSAAAFEDRLSAVLEMIDNGAIGGGLGYGCDEHKAALIEVEKQIARTRERISEMEAEEAENDSTI